MDPLFHRCLSVLCLCIALVAVFTPALRSQTQDGAKDNLARVQGTVNDSQNHPLASATVTLLSGDDAHTVIVRTDLRGKYRFDAVPGTYCLRASSPGFVDRTEGPFVVQQKELKTVSLRLSTREVSASASDALSAVEFSEEPHFTVSGVTDPTNLGGHGSDTVLRTKESLAKETAALNPQPSVASPPDDNPSKSDDAADAYARLGDTAEREGHPVEAVKQYQRAAQLQPNESHLFIWGAELLLHRAFEPAIEVFAKGHKLYPNSVRMLLGLSVAIYDQGNTELGVQLLLQACDLHPSDPTPYLFLGKLQAAEKLEPPGWAERLKRFGSLHPENAMAHYYYAVALSKQSPGAGDFTTVESELKRALQLNPRLGEAYLQLGILYSSKQNYGAAIAAFQKAIETLPLPDEAHYRLAQIYRQTGEAEKARHEMALYDQISHQKTTEAESQRHEIQQFVYTLRGENVPSPAPARNPQ